MHSLLQSRSLSHILRVVDCVDCLTDMRHVSLTEQNFWGFLYHSPVSTWFASFYGRVTTTYWYIIFCNKTSRLRWIRLFISKHFRTKQLAANNKKTERKGQTSVSTQQSSRSDVGIVVRFSSCVHVSRRQSLCSHRHTTLVASQVFSKSRNIKRTCLV